MNKTQLLTSLSVLAVAATASLNAAAYSQYITKVYSFCPAPGQYVNEMPVYTAGDDSIAMADKCTEMIANNARRAISLGGFGGFIVFGFDHPVKNVENEPDFKITGNAFYSNDNSNPDAPKEAGSCEPGIIMVSRDENQNGLPDDEWYELKGSEYSSSSSIHDYSITYYRPDASKPATPNPDDNAILDTTYIKWDDNKGNSGYIEKIKYNTQSYWPQWQNDAESITFHGSRLASNIFDDGDDYNFVLFAYPWGYVDNHPNNDDRCRFDIDNAVDSDGNSVNLPDIDFIKVYTAVNQNCGWLGTTSTEITGAEDLHTPTGIPGNSLSDTPSMLFEGNILTTTGLSTDSEIYICDLNGKIVNIFTATNQQQNDFELNIGKGIYIVKCTDPNLQPKKIIIK